MEEMMISIITEELKDKIFKIISNDEISLEERIYMIKKIQSNIEYTFESALDYLRVKA